MLHIALIASSLVVVAIATAVMIGASIEILSRTARQFARDVRASRSRRARG